MHLWLQGLHGVVQCTFAVQLVMHNDVTAQVAEHTAEQNAWNVP